MKYSEAEANTETQSITNTKTQCSNLNTTVMHNTKILNLFDTFLCQDFF